MTPSPPSGREPRPGSARSTWRRSASALASRNGTWARCLAELRFPGVGSAGLAVGRLGTSSVVSRLALFGAGRKEPAAVGRFVHVYVDRDTRRPVPVPDVIRAALATLRR